MFYSTGPSDIYKTTYDNLTKSYGIYFTRLTNFLAFSLPVPLGRIKILYRKIMSQEFCNWATGIAQMANLKRPNHSANMAFLPKLQ